MSFDLKQLQAQIDAIHARVHKCLELLRQNTPSALSEAEIAIMRFREDFPSNMFSYALLGALALLQQRYEESAVYTRKAIEIGPQESWLFYNLSSALRASKNYSEALDMAKMAIVKAYSLEDEANGYVCLGRAHMELYQFNLAGKNFDKAAESVQPPIEEFFTSMFVLLAATGNTKRALSLCDPSNLALPQWDFVGGSLPVEGAIHQAFAPLYTFTARALQEGHSPDLVLDCLDLPPDDLTPGTPEYIDWWRQELYDPDWRESVEATLEILANPGLVKEIEEGLEKDVEALTSWADFKAEMGA